MNPQPQPEVRAALQAAERWRIPTPALHQLEHWSLALADDIAWLVLDRAAESVNTLSEAVLRELDQMLDHIESITCKALVVCSAKSSGFAAGADIRDFRGMASAAAASQLLQEAHRVIDRLARLRIPTIALVHGHCLGGGLELALACRYIIATPNASFGFPEVLLGLHPGLGGTFRLPARIDPLTAVTLMLTGKSVRAARARRLGLVNAVVEYRHVAAAIEAAAADRLPRRGRGWQAPFLEWAPVRKLVARRMREQAARQAPPQHYPAPAALINLWEQHAGRPRAMQAAEIRSFAHLLSGSTSRNLVRAYFLREKLRALGKGQSEVKHVHVIGAGTMGAEIAAWCAIRGKRVTLSDLSPQALAKAVAVARELAQRRLHSSIEQRDAMDRLIPDTEGAGVAGADLIIEAIAEKAEVKRKVFSDLAPRLKPHAILATNTSSIALEALRDAVPDPSRLVGIHFFNPVSRMELVEVVAHNQVDSTTLARARAFCGDISRLPAPVNSSPGFVVNRALTPYLAEAFLLLDEGVQKETIDRAARDFGMPMGPIELADRVGLDICLQVARTLHEAFPQEVPAVPDWLERKVTRGELGRKSGKGLYDYNDKGKPQRADAPPPPAELADRLVLPMLNTCVRLLREGVAADRDVIDAAMIFGTGFAPFRGGPLHYASERGVQNVVQTLERLAEAHGERFNPDPGWAHLQEPIAAT